MGTHRDAMKLYLGSHRLFTLTTTVCWDENCVDDSNLEAVIAGTYQQYFCFNSLNTFFKRKFLSDPDNVLARSYLPY